MDPTYVFLMQPYGAKHSNILLETISDELNEIDCITKRADRDSTNAGFRLQDRIDDYIKKADICIADLTDVQNETDLTGRRNENVLLEVGAALSLQIPVVILSNDSLPSNIEGNIYVDLDPEKLFDESENKKFRAILQKRMKEGKNLIGRANTENFVAHGYPNREGVDFDLLIRRSERRICILTTNLGYVVGQPLISESHPHGRTMISSLIEELPKKKNPGFQANILALDPDSNFTNERADSLHRSRRNFRETMRQNLDILASELRNLKNTNVDIRIYDKQPLQMTFFFDDIIVNSVVAASTSSRFCVTYVHNLSHQSARDTFERHFNELWGPSPSYFPGSELGRETDLPVTNHEITK